LISCTRFVVHWQTVSLEPPYGTCGTQPLQYYNASEVYTAARCGMECQVDSLKHACGCKQYYMPGMINQPERFGMLKAVNTVLSASGLRPFVLFVSPEFLAVLYTCVVVASSYSYCIKRSGLRYRSCCQYCLLQQLLHII